MELGFGSLRNLVVTVRLVSRRDRFSVGRRSKRGFHLRERKEAAAICDFGILRFRDFGVCLAGLLVCLLSKTVEGRRDICVLGGLGLFLSVWM